MVKFPLSTIVLLVASEPAVPPLPSSAVPFVIVVVPP
jgi:hypothetical protein